METYAVLLKNSRCLVGNSSSGIRECEFLGVPVVNIGTRQTGRERASNVTDVPHDAAAIRTAVYAMAHTKPKRSMLYGDGTAGEKVAEILMA